MSIKTSHHLLAKEIRHREYSGPDYVAYCGKIRENFFHAEEEPQDKAFLERQFVDEMELRVKYCNEELTDGWILRGSKKIYVEFTCAKEHYLHQYAISEMKKGRLVSLNYTSTDVSWLKQRADLHAVEMADLDEAACVHVMTARERINNKLARNWPCRENWLGIIIDDVAHQASVLRPLLDEVYADVRKALVEAGIHQLWFIGYKGLLEQRIVGTE